ncbi:ABC transporter ATP-binding protein [Lentibacillus cibarius]|uniref:Carnitine transport ATP-binding protein OpuCA n=1 Tax=Lentibacillus cibarius TaxID=2583219 RepID=A0A549YFC2_9BACI|nr:ABC transporter ATP-binding protein [Lentibacillus cibarius]TRM10590.1 ABC transporter ATP-binding protein [Lentibacillus cibarius]
MIEVENVTKTYDGETYAVNDVSFHVPEGDTVVLLGPSGCGKTTLLRMVNRLVSITGGMISVNNQDIQTQDKIQLRRNIGYVIQSNALFPNMTIEENIVVVPDMLGWSKTEKHKRYRELMELTSLDPDYYQKRYPHELSGGQQQRIGIARALAANPPVMLMDEPFGALDPILRTHIQDEFLRIQSEIKKTILFVSHDIDEAIKMGDKVAIFKEGQLMQYDTPSEILTHPNSSFVADFVGQDRALKSLSLHTVEDLVVMLSLLPENSKGKVSKDISMRSNLRDALSILLNQEADQLNVVNEQNQSIGILTISLIEQYLHGVVKGKDTLEGVKA